MYIAVTKPIVYPSELFFSCFKKNILFQSLCQILSCLSLLVIKSGIQKVKLRSLFLMSLQSDESNLMILKSECDSENALSCCTL